MKIYIATCATECLIYDQSIEETVQDILWAGHPYPSLEEAKQSCQDFVDNMWGDEDSPTLQWTIKGDIDISAWGAECEEHTFLIREYEV